MMAEEVPALQDAGYISYIAASAICHFDVGGLAATLASWTPATSACVRLPVTGRSPVATETPARPLHGRVTSCPSARAVTGCLAKPGARVYG
jgi:hypothetical protein